MRVLKWLVNLLGLLFIIPLAIVIGFNLKDQPPSPSALQLDELLQQPALADRDNAYLYLNGFAVAPQDDPFAAGQRCLQSHSACPDTLLQLEQPTQQLIQLCRRANADCLLDATQQLDDLLQQDDWAIQRYRQLLGHAGWRDPIGSHDLRSLPSPAFRSTQQAQMLWLLQAWQLAANSEQQRSAIEMLQQDAVFWRRVLTDSRLITSRMAAAAALRQNLQWTNLVLRRLPAGQAAYNLPAIWLRPFNSTELSLRPAMAGEWRGVQQAIAIHARPMLGLGDSLQQLDPLLDRLYLPQVTANRYADLLGAVSGRLNRQFPACSADIRDARRIHDEIMDSSFSIYNPLGYLILEQAVHDFTQYTATLTALESGRRNLLLMQRMRDAALTPEQVRRQLLRSNEERICPDSQLDWDDKTMTLQVSGPGESGTTRYALLW